jgi:hypothetical protein
MLERWQCFFYLLTPSIMAFSFLVERKISMHIVEKWLLTYQNEELTITPKNVSIHAPLNRVIDKVGHYLISFIEIESIIYIVTYEPIEAIGSITKLLVTKFIKTDEGDKMTNLEESDRKNMQLIANHFMKTSFSLNLKQTKYN